jgi:DNA-directed RNA polymerase specialized sigma24 family protein
MRIYAELAEKFDVSERHVLRVVARIRRQLEQESDRTSI